MVALPLMDSAVGGAWGRTPSWGGAGTQEGSAEPGSGRGPQHTLAKVPAPLTCRRKLSASAARPAAMHWKEAFWPALTSTSPRREKCGAFAAGIQPRSESGLRPLQAELRGPTSLTPHPSGLELTAGVAEEQDVI